MVGPDLCIIGNIYKIFKKILLSIVYKNLTIIVGNVYTFVAVTADYNVCKKSVRMINFTFHLLSNQTVLIRSKNWCC